jgi:hypothetical protein
MFVFPEQTARPTKQFSFHIEGRDGLNGLSIVQFVASTEYSVAKEFVPGEIRKEMAWALLRSSW